MFISRLYLNPANREVVRNYTNCQTLHKTILRAFPQAGSPNAREKFGILFRVEYRRNQQPYIMIQSNIRPDWQSLPKSFLVPEEIVGRANPEIKEIDLDSLKFTQGMPFRFRIRANPTKKIETTLKSERLEGKKSNGRRKPIYNHEKQIEWFLRKAKDHGFRVTHVKANTNVENLNANPSGKIYGSKQTKKSGELTETEASSSEPNEKLSVKMNQKSTMAFYGVLFEGFLEITDPTLFKKTLITGIGSGKAYGFGYFSIARM